MNLVDLHVKKCGEHRRVFALADGVALVVAKAQMRREITLADNRLNGAVKDVDEALRVFAMRVARHRRFIDCDLPATFADERFEFRAHERKKSFGERVAVFVLIAREQAPAERVRTRNGSLQRGIKAHGWQSVGFRNARESFVFLDRTKSA